MPKVFCLVKLAARGRLKKVTFFGPAHVQINFLKLFEKIYMQVETPSESPGLGDYFAWSNFSGTFGTFELLSKMCFLVFWT